MIMEDYKDLISLRFYNRTSELWGEYRVEEYIGTKGKTKVPYFSIRFKKTKNIVECPLKTILENRVVDIERQKKETKKKTRQKKKDARQDRKEAKRFILNLGKEPRLLALDISTHSTGFAIFIGNKLVKYGYIYQSYSVKWDTIRINYMKNEIIKLVDEYEINCVAMEDIIFKSKKALYALSKAQGVIADYLFSDNIRYLLITPREWKSAYNINRDDNYYGKNSREESKIKTVNCVNKDFKLNLENEFKDYPKDLKEPAYFDVADAIGIGDIALKNRIKI